MKEPAILMGYCETCNPPGGRVIVVEVRCRRGKVFRMCHNCLRTYLEAIERKIKEHHAE